MKTEHAEILKKLSEYLEKCPNARFGQALFNLGINEFKDKENPQKAKYLLRDIYNDSDQQVLDRIQSSFSSSGSGVLPAS